MKRLLVISWEMPPLSGPRAVQVTRTLRELARLGWQSRVICFGARSNRYNQNYHIDVERETSGAVRRVPIASPEEWFFFRTLWRVCPAIKHLPDEKRVWVARAREAGRRTLQEFPADLIVSFAQPWSDHLVGLGLHHDTGLPLVAHFSDPWLDSPYLRGASWQRRIWSRMERDVVGESMRVVFVNRQTADRVMAKYPAGWASKARVVPQGWDPAAVLNAEARQTAGPLRIVYTGRFYDRVRTPDAFLRAVAVLAAQRSLEGRLLVEFVGGEMKPYESLATRLHVGSFVRFTGRKSPPEALAAATAADVLLVIDAPSEGANLYLPSKLVDYLPLARPILALTPHQGASAELVRQLGYPTIDPTGERAIASALSSLIDRHEAGALTTSPQHAGVAARYDIGETTRALAAVLDEAVLPS